LTAYDSAILALPALKAYWPLDDTAGHTTGRELSGRNIQALSAMGAGSGSFGNPSILPGDTSTCFHKTGSGDGGYLTWASLSTAGKADVNQTGPITLLAWIQPDTFVVTDTNLRQYIIGQFGAYDMHLTGQGLTGNLTGATPSTVSMSGIAAINTPAFIATVYDQTNSQAWCAVNGKQGPIQTTTGNLTTATNTLEIGGIISAAPFKGYLQKLALIGTAIPIATLQALYILGYATGTETPGKSINVFPFSRQVVPASIRNSITLTNDGPNPVYLSLSDTTIPAVAHQGARIAPNGGQWTSTSWDGPIQAIHPNWLGANLILIQQT
jgi:Concanavalin A-like lectin/glucanases superfamily